MSERSEGGTSERLISLFMVITLYFIGAFLFGFSFLSLPFSSIPFKRKKTRTRVSLSFPFLLPFHYNGPKWNKGSVNEMEGKEKRKHTRHSLHSLLSLFIPFSFPFHFRSLSLKWKGMEVRKRKRNEKRERKRMKQTYSWLYLYSMTHFSLCSRLISFSCSPCH